MGKVSPVQEPQLSSEGGSAAGIRGPHGSCLEERKD